MSYQPAQLFRLASISILVDPIRRALASRVWRNPERRLHAGLASYPEYLDQLWQMSEIRRRVSYRHLRLEADSECSMPGVGSGKSSAR